jgi:hypothetical protein
LWPDWLDKLNAWATEANNQRQARFEAEFGLEPGSAAATEEWTLGMIVGSIGEARALGRAGELAAGIEKNTQRIPSATETAAYRVPDGLGKDLIEVKNRAKLGLTNQIRDYAAFAEETKRGFIPRRIDEVVEGAWNIHARTWHSTEVLEAMKKGKISAAELAAQLAADPQYQAKLRAQQAVSAEIGRAEQAVLGALANRGYRAASIQELLAKHTPLSRDLVEAILAVMQVTSESNVLERLVRALGAAREPFDARALTQLFERTDSEHLRWAIANTLAEVRPLKIHNWLLGAIRQPGYGRGREMLTLAVARTIPPKVANQVLVELLAEMPGHAALGLAESGGGDELGELELAYAAARGWEKEQIGRTIAIIKRRLQEQ